MNRHTCSLVLALAMTPSMAAWALGGSANLRIGDPAPKFKVGKWLKGQPVSRLKKGKVYVLDFWGTLCEPCIKAFPLVSKLARQYSGRATFIGISMVRWSAEQAYPESSTPSQLAFMKKHGADMTYNVVMDSPDGYMARNLFMKCSDGWLPHAFIIDRQGKIAWSGSPESLNTSLDKVLSSRS